MCIVHISGNPCKYRDGIVECISSGIVEKSAYFLRSDKYYVQFDYYHCCQLDWTAAGDWNDFKYAGDWLACGFF